MKTKIVLLAALCTTLAGFSQNKWTLKECVHHAIKNNISIKQGKLNVQLAQKDVEISKGNFLPDLNGSSNGAFSSGLSLDKNGVLKNTQNFNSSFNLSSSGMIFNGFRNLNSKKQALLGVQTTKFDLLKIENDISLQVVNSYLNVLFAKENLIVAQTQAQISKKQINNINIQFEAGVIAKGDVLIVASTAAKDMQSVVLQQNTLNLAILQLAQLLQVSSMNFQVAVLNIEAPSAVLLYQNITDVYEKALNTRPEINSAKLNVKTATLAIELAKGAYYPTLTYSLSAGSSFFHQFNNLALGQFNNYFSKQLNDRMQYRAGISLNIPVFNRFQTKNKVAKSIINKEQSEFALQSKKLALQQEIEKAFLDVKAAIKSFEAAKISLEAQEEAFKNAEVRYEYGSITQFDFDQVRNRLVNVKSAMIRSKYDYVFKTKVLKFYFGESIVD